jgi:hypothetical protein
MGISINGGAFETAVNTNGPCNNLGVGGDAHCGWFLNAFPRYWDGAIARVGLWNRVLTDAEVSDLYNGGSGYDYANLPSGGDYTGNQYRVIATEGATESPPSNVVTIENTNGLLTDLAHWWEMDEASGTRVDSHGSLDLPLAPTSTAVPSRNVIGGDGADFNGTNNWLRSAGVGTPGWDLQEFTVAAWVNLDALSGTFRTFLSYGDFGASAPPWTTIGCGLGYRTGVGMELFTGHGTALGQIQRTVSPPTTTGVSYLVVAYFSDSANEMGISVNAESYQTVANTNGAINSSSSWPIDAARYKTSGPFMLDGGIARAAIWGRALSHAEVTDLYNGGNGLTYADLD